MANTKCLKLKLNRLFERKSTLKTLETLTSKHLRLMCLPDLRNTDADIIVCNGNFNRDKIDIVTKSSRLNQFLYRDPTSVHLV